MSLTWAGTSVLAALTDSASVGANTFTTAATWCSAPGSSTLIASADAWINEAVPAQNNGTGASLSVQSRSSARNQRSLLRFSLPAAPSGCTLSAASLRLYNAVPTAGRVIEVYQASPASPLWTETALTWANRPGTAGTAVPSTTVASAGWQTWTVTTHVLAQYGGTNNGLVVRDQAESSTGSAQTQTYGSRENPILRPELVITWS